MILATVISSSWPMLEALSAIGTAAGAFAVVATSPLLLWQLAETRRASEAAAFFTAIDQLQSEEIRQARATVFGLRGIPVDKWTLEQTAAAEKVCHTYGAVGIMVHSRMLPKKVILESWKSSLVDMWPIVRPLVMQYRASRGHQFWGHLEWLAHEAYVYTIPESLFAVPHEWDAKMSHTTDPVPSDVRN